MIFYNIDHEKNYEATLNLMKPKDCYHKSLAYLLTLDTVCYEHIRELFDFLDNSIIPEGLYAAWQTSTSKRTSRLAFNLWNGYCSDGETYIANDGFEDDLPSSYYSVSSIFCCQYAPYYWEAIKLRYPEFTEISEV